NNPPPNNPPPNNPPPNNPPPNNPPPNNPPPNNPPPNNPPPPPEETDPDGGDDREDVDPTDPDGDDGGSEISAFDDVDPAATMPLRVAACESGPGDATTAFTDVAETSFAYNDVACIYALEVTTGTSETTYSPKDPVTRVQMASFLARLYEQVNGAAAPVAATPFTDVAEGSSASDDVGRIYGLGITTGTSETTYSPTDPVTRVQMASFLARLYERVNGAAAPVVATPFTDLADGSAASDDVGRIYGLGITTGTSATTYSPEVTVTREQMAKFLANLYRSLTAAQR
ncbi:MAG: S-layer homology domain-containing protein, partial [Acidimicrobiaceae bacterium]|nr:S-layer homology domain-containing protein [Acidimicrobiaceae bacterium]